LCEFVQKEYQTNAIHCKLMEHERWAKYFATCYTAKPGVGNLRHACHMWHSMQFLMACRSSTFYISILLWFTQKVSWPWLLWKYGRC